MPRYTQLLFDVDDTLFDFTYAESAALTKTLIALGINCDDGVVDIYRRVNGELWAAHERGELGRVELLGSRFGLLFEAIGVSRDSHGVNERYLEALGRESRMIEGAAELCHTLHSHGCRLFLATNGFAAAQRGRLAASPVADCFEDVFVSDELDCVKPQIEYFQRMSDRILGFSQSKALMIGDTLLTDILGGNRAGIDTCWYNPSAKMTHDNILPTYDIRDLKELLSIVL